MIKKACILAFVISFGASVCAKQITLPTSTSAKSTWPTQVVATDQALHVLNRLTFGPRPGDLAAVKAIGVQAFIEKQLTPSSLPESPAILRLKSRSNTARLNATELLQQFREAQEENRANKAGGAQTQNNKMRFLHQASQQYGQLRLLREIESSRQLEELMVDFWFNHFNVCNSKGPVRVLIGPYEEQAIRPYVFGKFRTLLEATCYHPAMLFYLDNWENTAPNSKGARGKQNGLNENYARELMELHTLGVDGGYTQKDVIELAKILTGLGLSDPKKINNLQAVGYFGAYFDSTRHDYGDKTLLRRHFVGSGSREVEEALIMLSKDPATARHISYKLAQYFVSDNPPVSLVNKLTLRFQKTDGDIKAVLRELFYSSEFWSPKYVQAKYKSPIRYAISAVRATGSHPQNLMGLEQFLRLQGEPLYGCLTPDGYKNTKEAWLNPDSLLNRINFASLLTSGNFQGISSPAVEYRQLGATITGGKFSPRTIAVVTKNQAPLNSALLLGSPEFMHY